MIFERLIKEREKEKKIKIKEKYVICHRVETVWNDCKQASIISLIL